MRISIIMPVLNEEAGLEHSLVPLVQQWAKHEFELLIVDGGSTDNTVAIAEQFGKVIHSPRGRAKQMNMGAKVAQGNVLLFLHADTVLPDTAFTAIEQELMSSNIVAGAFKLRFDYDSLPYKLVAFSANLRSRLGNIFTGDQAYFVRAESFRAIGGYPDQPLMEDLEIITRLRKIGNVVLLPQYVITSARRHQEIGLLRSVLFMWYLRTLYTFGTSPLRLQQMYLDIR